MKKFLFAVVFSVLFSCGVNHSVNPVETGGSGSADVTINVGAVGALAKTANIALAKLYITLSAPGQTAISDSFALSGTVSTTINKTYANLASFLTWTLTARSIDSRDTVIHSGSTTFPVQPNQTVSVSLSLSAKYSMLKANFYPIRDSVTECRLMVDSPAVVRDSVFAKQALVGDTIRLVYDYLTASAAGIQHTIKMDVNGVMWGLPYLLYTGDTVITTISGQNQSYTITLNWVGPTTPPPGEATIKVTLGAVGTVTVNGNLGSGVEMAAGGYEHSVIVMTDGSLWACGWNHYGQLGNGDTIQQHTPIQILSSGVKSVAAGYYHTLIVKTDGSLWGCGFGVGGTLGNGNTTNQLTPIQILSSGVRSVAAGWFHTLIVKTDGSLWAFGQNGSGQLGNGNTTNQLTPIQILSSGVQSVAAGASHTLIVKTDGSLWACGDNLLGQLGNGDTISQSTPIEILGSGVQSVAGGNSHTVIVKTDGSLWSCGNNTFGQLGNGNTTGQLTPIQILSSGVQSVAAGDFSTLIVMNNGSLWGCGYACMGQLGIESCVNQLSPIQILNSGVQSVAAGLYHTLIVKADGSLWDCGYNIYGELGDGTTVTRFVPTPINLP